MGKPSDLNEDASIDICDGPSLDSLTVPEEAPDIIPRINVSLSSENTKSMLNSPRQYNGTENGIQSPKGDWGSGIFSELDEVHYRNCEDKLNDVWGTLRTHKIKVIYVMLTISLLIASVLILAYQPDHDWAGIPVWRWILYMAFAFPSWTLATVFLLLVRWLMSKAVEINLCGLADQDEDINHLRQLFFEIKLFLDRYWTASIRLLWSLFMIGIFSLCFDPTVGKAAPNEQWEEIYAWLLQLHGIIVLFNVGRICTHAIEFVYLTGFSAKILNDKIDESLFAEVVLSGLASLSSSQAQRLLPSALFEGVIIDSSSVGRKEHAAVQYILEHTMGHCFMLKMNLGTERTKMVIAGIMAKMKYNIAKYRIKLIKTTQKPKESTVQFEEENKSQGKSERGKTLDKFKQKPKKSTSQFEEENKSQEKSERERRHLDKTASTYTLSGRKRELVDKRVIEMILEDEFSGSLNIQQALHFLECNETISTGELQEKVEEAFTSRSNLITSLRDNADVTQQIKMWIWIIISSLIIIIAVFILSPTSSSESWLGFSSVILGFSFVFGGAAKVAFDNFIFLFGSSPYDVGDMIRLGTDDNLYLIKRVHLQATELESFGETRIVQNETIRRTEPLVNVSRSTSHWLTVNYELNVDVVNPEFLEKVEHELGSFFELYPETYTGTYRVDAFDFLRLEKVRLALIFEVAFPQKAFSPSRRAQTKAAVQFAKILRNNGAKYTIPFKEADVLA